MVYTGSPVVMGSWRLGREIIWGSCYKRLKETVISSSSGSRCLILTGAGWFCGAMGMAGGDWALLSCHPLPSQHLQGMQQWPFFLAPPSTSSDKGESPLASGLRHSWAHLGVFTEPHRNLSSCPSSLCVVYLSLSPITSFLLCWALRKHYIGHNIIAKHQEFIHFQVA